MIENGNKVQICFALFLEDGTQVAGNTKDEPLEITVGNQDIMPAVEAAMVGMDVGDQKKIVLTPDEAYGPVHEEGFQEVPLSDIPEELREVGAVLPAQNESGEVFHLEVHEVKDDVVVVNLNHPLAGKTLTFDVEILGIQQFP
jgi:FKBP-type peptidyl-prolyl cis-trans isomerase 2